MNDLHQADGFTIKSQGFTALPDSIYPRESFTVQIDIISQFRQFSGKLFIKTL